MDIGWLRGRVKLLLLAFGMAGCFTPADVALQRDPALWTRRDCLAIMTAAMRTNFLDQSCPNIKVIATPYTAAVIQAIQRFAQIRNKWTEAEYRRQTDTLLAQTAGLYLDWINGILMNGSGAIVRDAGQLDSLLFLVTIRNNAYPCAMPKVDFVRTTGGAGSPVVATSSPLFKNPSDYPCYDPDISNLDQRIALENDRGDSVRPIFVWGRRNNRLMPEETIFVRFPLERGDRRFLARSSDMYLVIRGFEGPIRLKFPVASLR